MPQGSIALPGNLQSHHGETSEQQRCDTESFLAAVAGQGVLTSSCSSWPASHVACNAHAPASHVRNPNPNPLASPHPNSISRPHPHPHPNQVRNVCGEGSAPAAHVGGGGGGSGLGLSVSGGMGDQGPLSPSRGPLPGYEQVRVNP